MEEVAPGLLLGRERVVEAAHRVGRVGEAQEELGEGVDLVLGERGVASEQAGEGRVELPEAGAFVEAPAVGLLVRDRSRGRGRRKAARAVAAPVHGAMVGHAAQALRHHRPLHGVGLERKGWVEGEGAGHGLGEAVRIAEVPGQAIEVTGCVAARAGAVAVARGIGRVVEQAATAHHLGGLGVVQGDVCDLAVPGEIHDREGVVEAGIRVEQAVPSSSTRPLGPPPLTGM